jgi:hypothetical protein
MPRLGRGGSRASRIIEGTSKNSHYVLRCQGVGRWVVSQPCGRPLQRWTKAYRRRRFFLGESGTGDWYPPDNNRLIRDFSYGVYMGDHAAQTLRAGLDGQSAWMLDDSMHNQAGSINAGNVPSGAPARDGDVKPWGMWNSEGTAIGR